MIKCAPLRPARPEPAPPGTARTRDLLGKRADSADVAALLQRARLPYAIVPDPERGTVTVRAPDGATYTAEELVVRARPGPGDIRFRARPQARSTARPAACAAPGNEPPWGRLGAGCGEVTGGRCARRRRAPRALGKLPHLLWGRGRAAAPTGARLA